MPTIKRLANGRFAGLLMSALLSLALAGCSKCDVPTWWHGNPAPQSCHDDAPAH
jgi:hypothetical protein